MNIKRLNGWRAVEAVLRTGGLAAAADEIGVTTAAVAAQVRGVEAAVGRPLFERGSWGLRPTSEARSLAPRLTSGFSAIADVQTEVAKADDDRLVFLAVTQTFAETWLPRHMPGLFARIEGLDLRLDSRWEVVSLGGGGPDMAIRFMNRADDTFEAVDLLPSGVTPICTPEFAKRYDLTPDTRSLDNVPIVHIEVPTTDPDWVEWDGWSQKTGIPIGPASPHNVSLTGAGIRIAMSGMGLVLGGMSEMFKAVEEGQLVAPLGPEAIVRASYWHRLIWARDRRLRKSERLFRDWIRERAEEDRRSLSEVFGWDGLV